MGQCQRLSCGLQALDQIGRPREEDTVSTADEFVAEAGRGVGFSRAWRPECQNVVAALQPCVALGQGHEMGLAEAGHEGEVEAIEGLAGRQAGLGEMALDAALFALGQFQFCECREQAGSRPGFLVGARAEFGPEPCDGGQAQGGEQRGQLGGVDGDVHAAISRDASSVS